MTTAVHAQASQVVYPKDVSAADYLLSSPMSHHLPSEFERASHPHHFFQGKEIDDETTFLLDAEKRFSLSYGAFKTHVSLISATLGRLVTEASDQKLPSKHVIHSPKTTAIIHVPNSFDFAVLLLGTMSAGLTASPISTLLTSREIAYMLSKARPRIIFTTQGGGEKKMRDALRLVGGSEPVAKPDLKAAELDTLAREWAADFSSDIERRMFIVHTEGDDVYPTPASLLSTSTSPKDWRSLLQGSAPPPLPCAMDAELQRRRAAILLWSSGTTGSSKGVLHSHGGIIFSTAALWHTWTCFSVPGHGPEGEGERWLGLAPWCHIFGMFTVLFPALVAGATIILPRPGTRFSLEVYMRLLKHHKVTAGHVAPPVLVSMHNSPLMQQIHLPHLKTWFSGGAPIAPDIIASIWAKTRKLVRSGYGTTETSHVSSPQSSSLDGAEARQALGSCGPPTLGVSVRVHGSDASVQHKAAWAREWEVQCASKRTRGLAAPEVASEVRHAPGELLVQSEGLMLGYFSGFGHEDDRGALDAELNAHAFTREGWYRTGDEGVIDKHGNVWITGRIKELIKVSGFQVAPVELDALFSTHPAVADAAACGTTERLVRASQRGARERSQPNLPSDEEVVIMYLQPKDPGVLRSEETQQQLVDEVSAWSSSLLAYYKQPRYICWVPVLIKSPTGKILRKELNGLRGIRHEIVRHRGTARQSSRL
ncbi:acetyl-CoA synthetase-like protein [Ceraceosorus guamensis]|uniref:Acetyl-CoA synthetase-like protein n=1 Tax=Ceraceosorus guamensis TaxID=1522189 RepID=A0A316VTJ6_9BASI|nr:acetyl-CoA synthetase-like protein [Ceraceosorus guamensis]PWN39541.1 acetyl-CoA synthetase-like protein [Ceraceosorus guamensis]